MWKRVSHNSGHEIGTSYLESNEVKVSNVTNTDGGYVIFKEYWRETSVTNYKIKNIRKERFVEAMITKNKEHKTLAPRAVTRVALKPVVRKVDTSLKKLITKAVIIKPIATAKKKKNNIKLYICSVLIMNNSKEVIPE